MVRKRIAARILAGVMLAAGLSAGATCRAVGGGFTDVAPEAWYAGEVGYVAENGLMSGTSDTTFSPDTPMTRAMLAAVLGVSGEKVVALVPLIRPFSRQ